ncbi:MAG: hypothetical protein RIK87_10020 [Fuerstiella sp.]
MAKKKTAAKGKKPATATSKVVKKKAVKKKAAAQSTSRKKAEKKAPVKKVKAKPAAKPVRKKGVRRATMTTGIRTKKSDKKIGRSRIPVDAPLSVVFEHFSDAQEAFEFLGIHTIRELEEFQPDELVMRLTSPAKQTVGRIRKILAMNNRCLANDEAFAVDFQDKLAQRKLDQ